MSRRGWKFCAKDEPVKKLAVANPDHAPYGRAAKQALEHDKLWDTVQPRVVMGENIAQTAQFVATGNADAGIVALSLVVAGKVVQGGQVAGDRLRISTLPLEQAVVLTKKPGPAIRWQARIWNFCAAPRRAPSLIGTDSACRKRRDEDEGCAGWADGARTLGPRLFMVGGLALLAVGAVSALLAHQRLATAPVLRKPSF